MGQYPFRIHYFRGCEALFETAGGERTGRMTGSVWISPVILVFLGVPNFSLQLLGIIITFLFFNYTTCFGDAIPDIPVEDADHFLVV